MLGQGLVGRAKSRQPTYSEYILQLRQNMVVYLNDNKHPFVAYICIRLQKGFFREQNCILSII